MQGKKEPTGFDLLTTLINLYAEQEGVKITYELKKEKTTWTKTF